ncbi:hypothetical protein BV22DRAFT_1134108 [Leucogyrophana mollusca]|uniref:Uncharacterized protein n=1 Tax=Leucogyrophana mollusca TaxID=85980 RepID=A0ACB8AZS3_9AGAM|nr:hypothetical protein BV22DRAFT_1134108 [Leucogyrophana mollusca]
MRTSGKIYQCGLLFLAAAAFVVGDSNDFNAVDPLPDCRAQSWVRAPDMAPGIVLEGDVKISLDGNCPEIRSYTLGLRFKERIFIKVLQEGAAVPTRPEVSYIWDVKDDIFDPRSHWGLKPSHDANSSEWKAYEEAVRKKDMWLVHEEETITFETRYPLGLPESDSVTKDFVSKFGLLVPDTNFPPAVDHRRSPAGIGGDEVVEVESIYEYFTEIRFTTGASKEIPAGMTAFIPVSFSATGEAESKMTLQLESEDTKPKFSEANYTAEVTTPSGTSLHPGTSQNLSVVIHRSGFTNRTESVSNVQLYHRSRPVPQLIGLDLDRKSLSYRTILEPRMLATTLVSGPNSIDKLLMLTSKLSKAFNQPSKILLPNAEDGHLHNTSSEPIILPFSVDIEALPDFSTRYQELGHQFCVAITLPEPSEDRSTPTHSFDQQQEKSVVDDAYYDWVPWSKVIGDPSSRTFQGCAKISISLKGPPSSSTATPTHYLSTDARTPVFVDPSEIQDLLKLTREERNIRAPIVTPVVKVVSKGEEKIRRYFSTNDLRYPIYVGETWVKKVLAHLQRDSGRKDNHEGALVLQTS